MYSFNIDRLEVRTAIEGEKKRYIVKGYAAVPNKVGVYKWLKNSDGTTKSFKDMFTTDCINDINNQLMTKQIFVDKTHDIGMKYNVQKILNSIDAKTKKSGVDVAQYVEDAKSYLKSFDQLPLIKLNGFTVDANGFLVEAELNPHYRELDEEHLKVFDATWGSLRDGFLNSFSMNFKPVDVDYKDNGDESFAVFNKVDVYGLSLVNNGSVPGSNIVEVAMRSAQEFTEAKKMVEPGVDVNKVVEEAVTKALAAERARADAAASEERRKNDEMSKQRELEKRDNEWKAQEEAYRKQIAELESQTKSNRKSVVTSQPSSSSPVDDGEKKFVDKIKELFPEPKVDPSKMNPMQRYGYYNNPLNQTYNFSDLAKAATIQGMVRGDVRAGPIARKSSDDIVVHTPGQHVERH